MFGFGESKEKRDHVYSDDFEPQKHESSFLHEVVAGGAAFEAMKLYEDHQREKGEVVKHQFAKEVLAGFAAAEVDKLVETKGLDAIDREKAKHHAKKQAEHLYDEQYGNQEHYDPNSQERHETMRW